MNTENNRPAVVGQVEPTVMQHTPGPWAVNADGTNAGPDDGFQPFGGCGCCGSPWMSANSETQRNADAMLIAAAPELLACLRSLYRAPMGQGDYAAAGELLRRLGAA